jgi:hypothetical protein
MGQAADERKHATCERERCNGQETTRSTQRATDEMRCGTRGRQRTACDMGPWDGQRRTCDMQRRACSDDTQWAACKRPVQQATDGMQHTAKMQPTPCRVKHATSRQRAPCSGQYAANDMQRATRNMLHAPDFMQHTANNKRHATRQIPCNRQRATGNGQQTTWKRQQTACSGQRATRQQTPRSMRHAADGRHRAADSKQPATRNGQHATDTVQQTADNMHADASTCEMRQATCSTAVFRMRRAADGTHPAACAKHCMRQPVRNTAHTDAAHKMQHHHTSCAAAGSRPCNVRDETNAMLSLTGGVDCWI